MSDHCHQRAAVPASLIDALRGLLAERLSTAPAVLEQHGTDEGWHAASPPDAVAFASTTEEVAEIVRLCAADNVPIVPYGAGSSLEGHVVALRGGICIDMSRMNAILAVNNEDLDCRVQAGVTREQLNEYLRDTGLFFPIDPGANASIGGMTATRASGTNAVRYGTMRDNVLNLTVVTPDGKIIKTANRARKSSAGYDLTRLFVGSEGTLGVITEIGLKLYGIPEAISAAVCAFPSVEAAVNTTILTIQAGIPVARIELLDALQIRAINNYSKTDHKEAPTLFFEFHGTEASVKEQAEFVESVASEFGAEEFQWATKAEDRTRLWAARHKAYYASLQLEPGKRGMPTDVCVPISRLAEAITQTQADCDASPLTCTIVGHVGDGNFHTLILLDPENPVEMAEAKRLHDRMVERALAMGGTCTGEHGIGFGKLDFMEAEHGADTIALMRAIKNAIDPQGLMNPGKLVPGI
ncbi:FAD-linked oxidase C-terminal domain-containing protein [Thalassospira sp.]|uniref:FAD-linked oxidase C-terminal domain-containing protein n=1 Tax=Thalassospira sp. TaxID=1912094 RepID=UPI002732FCC7|nr:FAD-linked oxidase C-terminal domain-containing protein [Thalassospira sp.]MDP2696719.1 FAD-linked oxidase C-terminal domain-containing protein [Thalassospira sp.]